MMDKQGADPAEDGPVLDAEEREVIRERARETLGREPTEEEMAEWLQDHVEGY